MGVFDTMPTKRTVQSDPAILESLTPFPISLTTIDWHVSGNRNSTYSESGVGLAAQVARVYGYEHVIPRITLFVGARPHNEPEW